MLKKFVMAAAALVVLVYVVRALNDGDDPRGIVIKGPQESVGGRVTIEVKPEGEVQGRLVTGTEFGLGNCWVTARYPECKRER
jgi:hypothetical protein